MLRNVLLYVALCLIMILYACQPAGEQNSEADQHAFRIDSTAHAYFDTYAEREDWDKLCSFYAEDMTFNDVMLHLELDSLWQFKRFYNWPDTNFSKLFPEQKTLEVDDLVVTGNIAVARGHFNPFYWYGEKMGPGWGMEFCMWLYFNDDLKIERHVDWIEYDARVLEAVIARYRKDGVEKKPDWFDLSRQ